MTTTSAGGQVDANLDLVSPELVAEPFAALDELRRRSAAVHVPQFDFWVMPRHADVRAAAADGESSTSAQDMAPLLEFTVKLVGSVFVSDPPEHGQLRALTSSTGP